MSRPSASDRSGSEQPVDTVLVDTLGRPPVSVPQNGVVNSEQRSESTNTPLQASATINNNSPAPMDFSHITDVAAANLMFRMQAQYAAANHLFKDPPQPSAEQQLSSGLFYNRVMDWQSKNYPALQNSPATTDSAAQHTHHGLKSHFGSALFAMVTVAGSVANSVAGSRASLVSVSQANHMPALKVDAGHCPAMVDPAFQVPVRWWDALATELADPYMGPQWRFWLKAVQDVFQCRAEELKSTPGAAALHVIVNPNGTIFNMSPYTGFERSFANKPVSERMLLHLRDMVGTVGMFPPFPAGTKVRCYHLIFDGSSGI
ncbi:MAG: hypothetical protein JST44_21290 [Cyanobacteria bacterium SZAS LIN-5]|nr:hypothetical protein [Cyanobacteria bacterium SZAS LIN-5]